MTKEGRVLLNTATFVFQIKSCLLNIYILGALVEDTQRQVMVC